MSYSNSGLTKSFPSSVQDDAIKLVSVLPQPPSATETFSVCVANEIVSIPYRIYHDPVLIDRSQLTTRQGELLDCLLTRHHSGFIREKYLKSIVSANYEWIPPFVIQLVGEYVIEILQVVRENLDELDPHLYRAFLRANPRFFALTKQRVISYWDCYYRWNYRRVDYVGFQILEFMEQFLTVSQ